jgi:RluA family pseudouridine synthase
MDYSREIATLFENDDVLAVHKPEGLASIPGDTRETSLLALLAPRVAGKLYVVHRLDKEASGVILFARNATAHKCLNAQFSSRGVRKTYVALTHGVITEARGIIDGPLREFGSGRMGVDVQRGKRSVTEFEVIERLAAYTLLKAHPLTGRRHQIRVHLYSIGHPIVGDLRYGDRAAQRRFPRLMLHAQAIAFRLPTGEEVTVEAPLPESFQTVVESICRTEVTAQPPLSPCPFPPAERWERGV